MRLPSSLQATFIAAIAGASLTFCCAAYSGLGAGMQLAMQAQLGGGGGDPMMARMLELQRVASFVAIVLVVLQLASALGLVVGGALGLGGRPIGRTLTLAAFALVGAVVLAEIGVAVWSWSETQGMFTAISGGAPMGPEEARIVALAGAAGLIPTACWVFLKLALVAIGSAVLLSPEARAFYANVGPEGLRAGPRE